MGKYILFVSVLTLSGCGTLNTVTNSDQQISRNLIRQETSCKTIPRAYSGLAYDFCYLYSRPTRSQFYDGFLGLHVLDGAISIAADTVLLPYTGYKQYKHGSISINDEYLIP